MTNPELDALSKVLKITLESNTIVIFKAPKDECKQLAKSIECITVFKRFNIVPVVCPEEYQVIIIHPKE